MKYALTLLISFCFILPACGNPITKNELIGTWEVLDPADPAADIAYFEFKPDSSFTYIDNFLLRGKWALSKDTLRTEKQFFDFNYFTIKRLDELRLNMCAFKGEASHCVILRKIIDLSFDLNTVKDGLLAERMKLIQSFFEMAIGNPEKLPCFEKLRMDVVFVYESGRSTLLESDIPARVGKWRLKLIAQKELNPLLDSIGTYPLFILIGPEFKKDTALIGISWECIGESEATRDISAINGYTAKFKKERGKWVFAEYVSLEGESIGADFEQPESLFHAMKDRESYAPYDPFPGMTYNEYVESWDKHADTAVFTVVEEMPEFPGGDAAMLEYLRSPPYPKEAAEQELEGSAYVRFVIDQTGQVTKVELARGGETILDEAAIKHIKNMPVWKPGRQSGKPVKVQMVVPIRFSMPE